MKYLYACKKGDGFMKKNIDDRLNNLRQRAIQRKLSCPACKTKEDVKKEHENFQRLKSNIYAQIGR